MSWLQLQLAAPAALVAEITDFYLLKALLPSVAVMPLMNLFMSLPSVLLLLGNKHRY
ncbi:MAG: hypothetical protein HWD59_00460 [Coxiellaceae bacterium]|nr:MAG: hypothetical protein HWD59_00460 [Coxiellaceae bacterium]